MRVEKGSKVLSNKRLKAFSTHSRSKAMMMRILKKGVHKDTYTRIHMNTTPTYNL